MSTFALNFSLNISLFKKLYSTVIHSNSLYLVYDYHLLFGIIHGAAFRQVADLKAKMIKTMTDIDSLTLKQIYFTFLEDPLVQIFSGLKHKTLKNHRPDCS
jgi:hypothetical protein